MQLRRLRLKNIRSYESAEIELGPGTTLISGDVGSGKTSLLYSIEMALFGFAEVDATFLVRHGAPHAEVGIEMEGDGHRYAIARRFRRITRKGHHSFELERSTFSEDGATTQYSATELRQRVIDLFGFPDNPSPRAHSDLWRWAVYVPQERMREVLAQEPQERLETIRKALGVERYRAAAESAHDLAAEIRRTAAARAEEAERLHHWEADFGARSTEIVRLRGERSVLDAKRTELARAVESAEKARQDRSEALRVAEADRRERASLLREEEHDERVRSHTENELRQIVADLEILATENGPDRGPELATLRTRTSALEGERARITERLAGLAMKMQALATARAEAIAAEHRRDDRLRQLERTERSAGEARAALAAVTGEGPAREPPSPTPLSLPEIDATLVTVRASERSAVEAATRARADVREVDSLLSAGVCPRCRQKVHPDEFRVHRAESERALEAAEERLRSVQADREHREEERRSRERYERSHDRWAELQQRRSVAATAVQRADEERDRVRASIEEAESNVVSARARRDALEPVEGAERAERARATQLDAERARDLETIERYRREEEERRSRLLHREARERDRTRVDSDLVRLRARIAERAIQLARLGTKVAAIETLEREEASARTQLAELQAVEAENRAAAARTDARIEDSERRLAEAEEGVRERRRRLGEIEELRAKAAWTAGPFRETLFSIEEKLLASAQAMFERQFARYFASLIDDTGLEARVDVSFTPAVLIGGEWTPAEALSGGERTSLALAFRLALGQVVRTIGSLGLDTIILDEPTDGFSPEQIVRMGELFEELALPQVVLVSHEAELGAIADRVIRVEKRDGVSTLVASPSAGSDLPAEERRD